MQPVTPKTAEDLAFALRQASAKQRTVEVFGNNSKRLMAGPALPAEVTISTAGLKRILHYEPNDLTISVEAGMPFADLQATLANNKQMIALDPPYYAKATVGGVVASNSNGPMRRLFGTARDLVIGMKFATLEGKLISAGGMVVKNVAGLDISKLLIGSFGTLAAITSVNFRLHPMPEQTCTFVFSDNDLESLLDQRDKLMVSVLRPMAMDIISPPAATRLGLRGHVLAVRAAGSPKVLARYEKELPGSTKLTGHEDAALWSQVREFSGDFLRRQPNGVVLRISTKLADVPVLLRLISGSTICRAATGVTYVYLTSWQGLPPLWQAAIDNSWHAVVEFAPDENRGNKELWLLGPAEATAEGVEMMRKIKVMFDPNNLLNRSRLYGRI
jgi:glycolate oxidase FAD binding subunit